MLTLSLVVALTVAQPAPWVTGASQPEDLAITLVTFSPGDTLTEWWGHTAVVVEDRRLKEGRLYNYGMFGFEKGFVNQFVMGRLEFWVADDWPIAGTFNFYRSALGRDVRLQELDLLPAQAALIAKRLGENVLPANRYYLYQHYTDNCSTRPRDIIDEGLNGQLKAATAGPARMTLRQHTLRYSMVNPPMSLVLDYLQNDTLDQPMSQQGEAYLPDELERQVQALVVTRPDGSKVPLVKRQYDWFKSKRVPPPAQAPNWVGYLLVIGLAFAGLLLGLGHLGKTGKRAPRIVLGLVILLWGVLSGALGFTLFFIGTFTDHLVAHHNENLFLMSPINLALIPLGVMLAAGKPSAKPRLFQVWTLLAGLTLLGVLLKVLPAFDQANWNLIVLLGPVNVGGALLFWFEKRLTTARPR